jgi:hypothetical protein
VWCKSNRARDPHVTLADTLALSLPQVDPMRSGTRWKMVKSPLDTSRKNASLPPPLRTCWFCPAHHRSWIANAMRGLPTRVVLSHIAHNARPVWTNSEKRSTAINASDLGFELPPPKKGRRLPRKNQG